MTQLNAYAQQYKGNEKETVVDRQFESQQINQVRNQESNQLGVHQGMQPESAARECNKESATKNEQLGERGEEFNVRAPAEWIACTMM